MEPVPQTREVLDELGALGDDALRQELLRMGRRAVEIVPECLGLSLGLLREGLTLTLAATGDDIAALDAVQYLDGGPCVDAAQEDRDVQVDDVLDERRWRMYAEASAATGVRSSLTLPILAGDGTVIGSVNLYASTPGAFEGRVQELAEAVGSSATKAISNADLSFSTRLGAAEAPTRLAEQNELDVALGIIAESQGVTIPTAQERLRSAASRAGITEVQAARAVRGLLAP